MMKPPPTQKPFMDEMGNPDRAWVEWFLESFRYGRKYQGEFTTANRPTNSLNDGDWGIDTTLGYPIWYYNSGWIDSSGASV